MNFKTIIILAILVLFFFAVALFGNDLQEAIQKGDVTQVKTLISNNKELIHMKSEKGQTPLQLTRPDFYLRKERTSKLRMCIISLPLFLP
jgi:uncharacterized membrane protein YvbJ